MYKFIWNEDEYDSAHTWSVEILVVIKMFYSAKVRRSKLSRVRQMTVLYSQADNKKMHTLWHTYIGLSTFKRPTKSKRDASMKTKGGKNANLIFICTR